MSTKIETLKKLFSQHGLVAEDKFKHKHYTIITRSGIDKIQASTGINVTYQVIRCDPTFCVIKATGELNNSTIETFGSAVKGGQSEGNTNSWYVAEMAEKRAMSRAVLKLAGFYELNVFSEDESEEFSRKNKINITKTKTRNAKILAASKKSA